MQKAFFGRVVGCRLGVRCGEDSSTRDILEPPCTAPTLTSNPEAGHSAALVENGFADGQVQGPPRDAGQPILAPSQSLGPGHRWPGMLDQVLPSQDSVLSLLSDSFYHVMVAVSTGFTVC